MFGVRMTALARRSGQAFAKWPATGVRGLHAICGHACRQGARVNYVHHVQSRLRGSKAGRNQSSTAGDGALLLRGLGWCVGITSGSFFLAMLADNDAIAKKREGSVIIKSLFIGCVGVFTGVYLLGKIRTPTVRLWFERNFYANSASFRPAQVLGATLNHVNGFHLACNSFGLLTLFGVDSRLSDRSLYYTAALMLSSAAWCTLAYNGVYGRLFLGQWRRMQLRSSCGASAGLMAVLGSQVDVPGKRFRVLFTDIDLTCRQAVVLAASVDTVLLLLISAGIMRQAVHHAAHLLGLGFGFVLAKLGGVEALRLRLGRWWRNRDLSAASRPPP